MRQRQGDYSTSMNILALDTSMGACSVAILRESGGATTLDRARRGNDAGPRRSLDADACRSDGRGEARFCRARSHCRDARSRQLHRRAGCHCRRTRPRTGDQRKALGHGFADGDGARRACGSRRCVRSPFPSMRIAACSISDCSMATACASKVRFSSVQRMQRRKSLGTCTPLSAAAPRSSPRPQPTSASRSRHLVPTFSPMPRTSRCWRFNRTQPCRLCARFISGLRMPSRKAQAVWRAANADHAR